MNAESPQHENTYVLGNEPLELARLDRQAAWLEPATRQLLELAGIAPGMRVLDLGTGLGHVARLTGQLVGQAGSVVGLDQAGRVLAVARQRVEAAREHHVSFVEGDVSHWRADTPFDAVVGRLLLFHVANPVLVARHQLQNLRSGGLFVAIDYDVGAARTEPPVDLVADVRSWIVRAFEAAGASPYIGARLGPILAEAGFADPTTFGIQSYVPSGSPFGPAFLAGIVRSLANVITQHGFATAEQLGLDTLEQRIGDALQREQAVLLPPTLVGAWGWRANGTPNQ